MFKRGKFLLFSLNLRHISAGMTDMGPLVIQVVGKFALLIIVPRIEEIPLLDLPHEA